jgi:hypothetical protein
MLRWLVWLPAPPWPVWGAFTGNPFLVGLGTGIVIGGGFGLGVIAVLELVDEDPSIPATTVNPPSGDGELVGTPRVVLGAVPAAKGSVDAPPIDPDQIPNNPINGGEGDGGESGGGH